MPFLHLFATIAVVPQALACAGHQNYRRMTKGQNITNPLITTQRNWTYADSFDWGRIDPAYGLCHTGTQQSPIALTLQNGLATKHAPSFNYPDKVAGNLYNWAFGPAFTVIREDNVWTKNPSLTFDNETVYLSGWHIHTPADHSINMFRSRAEMHLVHVDAKGKERAVVAILIDAGHENNSFISQLPMPLIRFDDTEKQLEATLALHHAIPSASDLGGFWTYQGSLTSPPCQEGVRWFVARQAMYTSIQQMQMILAAGSYSSREEQKAWMHGINE